jgi:hypothetical protein
MGLESKMVRNSGPYKDMKADMGYPPSGDFDDPLPPDLEDRVNAEVEPGEKVAWVGRPRWNRYVYSTIPIVLFGIPWTAFAVFWVVMASGAANGGPGWSLFPLFGLPFVLIGFSMLSSPFWAARRSRRVAYAVTDRRVILLEPVLFGGLRVVSLSGDELGSMERVERADGTGDIIFGQSFRMVQGQGNAMPNLRRIVAIPHVREVESLIRRTLLVKGDVTT